MQAGNVTGTGDNVGGLIGYQESGINVTNSYDNSYSYIQECYATGKVLTVGNNVGGLIGYMHSYNRINNSYIQNSYASVQNSFATGEVTGAANVGGLVGYGYRQNVYNHTYQEAYLEITNCYAIGKVTASRSSRRISRTTCKCI